MADLPTIKTEARNAWLVLADGLDQLAAASRVTPCQADPDPFGSDDRAERKAAAEACAWCPLLEACAAFAEANDETSLVWAGVDRTRHPQTVRRHRREAVA